MQQRLGITAIIVSICLLSVDVTIAQPVEQNLPSSQVTPGTPIRFQASGEGTRMRRVTGGVREHCMIRGQRVLTVLLPENNPVLTTSERPELLMYIPKTARTSIQGFKLSLRDANEQVIYQEEFKANQKPGIFSINLTGNSKKPLLEVGQEYSWSLAVICDRSEPSYDQYVNGILKRIIPDENLSNNLKKASPRERAALYAASGIWYDSQATLVELLRQRPTDAALTADWQSLLESVRLSEIAKEPFIGELKAVAK